MRTLHLLAAAGSVAVLATFVSMSAKADTLPTTWTFTSSTGGTTNTAGAANGTAGIATVFTASGGEKLTAEAFSSTSSSGALSTAFLGQYLGTGYGLGVTNSLES